MMKMLKTVQVVCDFFVHGNLSINVYYTVSRSVYYYDNITETARKTYNYKQYYYIINNNSSHKYTALAQ